jgi:hypothetical protein
MGVLTPAAVGSAFAVVDGQPMEYLVTEWLPDAVPYHLRLREMRDRGDRARTLQQFAQHLRSWHGSGIYLRDLVKNVLTRGSAQSLEYWLTDLDQLHPIKHITRKRVLQQMRQLSLWTGPLTEWEADTIAMAYLGRAGERTLNAIAHVLLTTPPLEPPGA